ncbi:MAG TPA: class I SAM-dependent methyltransferase [Bacteroidia bacterium]|jgi:SAM-dependent methyltransferase|nr:class I SAM-dependent methyltransferase [Bacteroidia bacterium]
MSPKKEWYRNWFESPYYDLLYKERDQEEADMFIDNLVKHLAPPKNAVMLDLACGKGRYSIALNRMGYNVTGIDLSQRKITAAKENENSTLLFNVQDMRLPLESDKYNYVFNLFTSFGYFETDDENRAVLANVFKSLKKGGIFVLDYMNGEKVAKNLLGYEEFSIKDIHFSIERYVENNLIIKEIKINDGGETFNFSEKISIFTEEKLAELMTGCGFEIQEVFGDYQLHKFDAGTSERLIFIGRKP